MRYFGLSVVFVFLMSVSQSFAQDVKIEKGKKVKFDYTLKIDGKEVETSAGKTPIEYTDGEATIIPGLASELEGLKVGDQKTVVVEPKDGYGEVSEDAIKEFPASAFPKDFKAEVGMVVEFQDPENNQPIPGVIWEIKEDAVKVNFNHPLAGKVLEFDVKIVDIQ